MRNYPHRCRIVPKQSAGAPPEGGSGIGGESGLLRVWEDVPCHFAMMDAVKGEALFGAQANKGTLLIPHYVTIPEQHSQAQFKVYIGDYWVYLTSPRHLLVGQKMEIDTIRWSQAHLILQMDIPNVA